MAQFLTIPIIVLPGAGLLWYNSHQKSPEDRVQTSFLLNTWALSGFLGPTLAAPAQLAIGWPLGKLLLGDQLDRFIKEFTRPEREVYMLSAEALAERRVMAFSWQNVFGSVFLSVIAPCVEEAIKYIALRLVERYFPEKAKTKRNYVLIAMATGLGFALVESLAFIFSASEHETQAQLAITIIERGIFGTSGHLWTAALTGCKFAESRSANGAQKGMWSIINESLLYHALGNFGLFTSSMIRGHVGWVHPTDAVGVVSILAWVTGVNIMAAWRVSQELTKFDSMDAQKES